ncbi:glycosyltransferase [Alphaproteobacteria bacterium]|nr:glycosyltransferase [Alphaproteobacteria bacterium]
MFLNIVQDLKLQSGGVPRAALFLELILKETGSSVRTFETRNGMFSVLCFLLKNCFGNFPVKYLYPKFQEFGGGVNSEGRDLKAFFHGIWTPEFWLFALLMRTLGIPYFVFAHGMLDKESMKSSPVKKKLARLLIVDNYLRSAESVLVGSQQEVNSWPDDLKGLKTGVFANGAHTRKHAPLNKKMPLKLTKLLKKKRVFCYLGRTTPKKGLELLINSFESVHRKSRHAVSLLILGMTENPEYEQKIRSKIVGSSAHSDIYYSSDLTGDQARYVLSISSFFVLPSAHEGLPVSAIEALSFGVPAILTEQCNIFLDHSTGGETVVLCECSLSRAMLKLSNVSDKELKLIQKNAHNTFSERYSTEALLDQLEDIFGKEG